MKHVLFLAPVCGVLVAAGGCDFLATRLLPADAGRMRPDDFGLDDLQRRLARAVEAGDAAAVAAAVAAGADVDGQGRAGFRLLHWAMARGNPRGFELLLEQKASLDTDYRDTKYLRDATYGETMLQRVLGSQDTRFLEAALRQGLDPNRVPHPEDGRSLLFIAAYRHSIPVIEALLAAGAEIDRQENSGYTPLIEARMRRSYNEAWVLLRHGADPTMKDNMGHDFVWGLKEYGSRGVRPDHRKSFESIVTELVARGLLTRQDIVEADKPKRRPSDDGPPGVTVIEHAADSEAGQAILELDRVERESRERRSR